MTQEEFENRITTLYKSISQTNFIVALKRKNYLQAYFLQKYVDFSDEKIHEAIIEVQVNIQTSKKKRGGSSLLEKVMDSIPEKYKADVQAKIDEQVKQYNDGLEKKNQALSKSENTNDLYKTLVGPE